MLSQTRWTLCLALCSLFVSQASGQELVGKAKPKIEYRWMETVSIKGVTEEREIAASENLREHWFLHQKPIELTKEVNQKVVSEIENGGSRRLAIVVDGQYRGNLTIEKSSIKLYPDILALMSPPEANAKPQIKGELVSSKMIWGQARINRDSDIVRFKDRWFVVCQESAFESSTEAALRVISSADGDQWESVALIKSPTPRRILYRPSFSLTPDGQLMIAAQGAMRWESFDQSKPEPTPRRLAMAWFSKDGVAWSEPTPITGGDGYVLNRVVWSKDVALGFARGESCGNWDVNLFSSRDGRSFESVFASHFGNESRPGTLAMIVDGDRAHCLMSRSSATEVSGQQTRWPWKTGLLGTAKGPHYDEWKWKAINVPIAHANLLRCRISGSSPWPG